MTIYIHSLADTIGCKKKMASRDKKELRAVEQSVVGRSN